MLHRDRRALNLFLLKFIYLTATVVVGVTDKTTSAPYYKYTHNIQANKLINSLNSNKYKLGYGFSFCIRKVPCVQLLFRKHVRSLLYILDSWNNYKIYYWNCILALTGLCHVQGFQYHHSHYPKYVSQTTINLKRKRRESKTIFVFVISTCKCKSNSCQSVTHGRMCIS